MIIAAINSSILFINQLIYKLFNNQQNDNYNELIRKVNQGSYTSVGNSIVKYKVNLILECVLRTYDMQCRYNYSYLCILLVHKMAIITVCYSNCFV